MRRGSAGRHGRQAAGVVMLLVTAASAIGLVSCGSSPLPPSGSPTTRPIATTSTTTTPTTSTTAPPGPPCGVVANADIVFTSRTEPCAVTTRVGVTIHLALDRGFVWNDLKSDSPAVIVTDAHRPTSGGGLNADLHVEQVGRGIVTSTGGIACPPGQPCPALARLWRLDVTVVQTQPPPQTVMVTEADSGHGVTLHKGDGLDVVLAGPASYTWTEPVTSDQTVMNRVGAASGATASADFLAVGSGTATVTATDNPNCYPQCAAPSRAFQLTVSVTR